MPLLCTYIRISWTYTYFQCSFIIKITHQSGIICTSTKSVISQFTFPYILIHNWNCHIFRLLPNLWVWNSDLFSIFFLFTRNCIFSPFFFSYELLIHTFCTLFNWGVSPFFLLIHNTSLYNVDTKSLIIMLQKSSLSLSLLYSIYGVLCQLLINLFSLLTYTSVSCLRQTFPTLML